MADVETVEEHCIHKDCFYRMKLDSCVDFCAYAIIESQSRKCAISQCDKYRTGRSSRKVSIDFQTLEYRWYEEDDEGSY